MVTVLLEAWDDSGLDLLRRANAPEMTEFLGGPETDEQVLARHRRYLADGDMRRIVLTPGGPPVGTVGWWDREWRGETVLEAGWGVLPEYQGRGIARAAVTAAVAAARAEGRRGALHAFPKVDNAASNALCRAAGFTLLGEVDFEYPKGHPIRCHDWWVSLAEESGRVGGGEGE